MENSIKLAGGDCTASTVDVLVVGAGFAGMYMLYKLRQLGMRVQVVEAGKDVGGTWYWNRYPGARCDADSIEYSYSFSPELQREWSWTERFATQPEILSYALHVADRFALRSDILFETRVTGARYDKPRGRWLIDTDRGRHFDARYVVMATGCLSVPRKPSIPGADDFRGEQYHTGFWPHEPVSLKGKRVGVIGTGSSGIQVIPAIANEAAQLYVFQRTPNFSVPARNAPLSPEFQRWVQENYEQIRARARLTGSGTGESFTTPCLAVDEEERRQRYEALWEMGGPSFMRAFPDLLTNPDANRTAVEFIHEKIRSVVQDSAVATALSPTDHPVGTKRICVDTDYYATFNRPNVTLVDTRKAPIQRITAEGVQTSAGDYALDMIVYATGFDAMTGALLNIDIRGIDGQSLRDKWRHGPLAYLGLAIAGFPNLFTITGPGSPSVLSNVLMSIEQHVEWLAALFEHAKERGFPRIAVEEEAERSWVEHVNQVADATLYPQANSWYVGANIPGKPRVFMPYVGGVGRYRERCDAVAASGYTGLSFAP